MHGLLLWENNRRAHTIREILKSSSSKGPKGSKFTRKIRHFYITIASSKNFGGVMSKKKTQEFYSAIDEIADKEAFLESEREGFSEIEDPRAQDNQGYRFIDLLIVILCAILAGANTITDIHTYAQVKLGCFGNCSR
jgi:hypothetical protein